MNFTKIGSISDIAAEMVLVNVKGVCVELIMKVHGNRRTWLVIDLDLEFQTQAEIARQEARMKMERENLEKEKSVLMGTASNQDNQDGALEITVSGEKYRCLRFAKAKK